MEHTACLSGLQGEGRGAGQPSFSWWQHHFVFSSDHTSLVRQLNLGISGLVRTGGGGKGGGIGESSDLGEGEGGKGGGIGVSVDLREGGGGEGGGIGVCSGLGVGVGFGLRW